MSLSKELTVSLDPPLGSTRLGWGGALCVGAALRAEGCGREPAADTQDGVSPAEAIT